MADFDTAAFSRKVKENTRVRCEEIDQMIEALEAERIALKERDNAVDVMLEIFNETGENISSSQDTLKALAGFDLDGDFNHPRQNVILNRGTGSDGA